MNIRYIKALWGMEGPLEHQFEMISKAGYDGIEGLPPPADLAKKFSELLQQHNFLYISQAVTQPPDHLASLSAQLKYAAAFHPVSITVHSGKDSMTPDQQDLLYAQALKIEMEIGLPVNHETHRSRAFFTPWTTARVLRAHPNLSLAADFSHWCVVTESMLEDYETDVALACTRSRHLHARVGHPQGPQISDPRAPEYKRYLVRHEEWWDAIVAHHKKQGSHSLTITPEFGPPDYMHTHPYSRQPLSNLWDVCLWMRDRLRQRYDKRPNSL